MTELLLSIPFEGPCAALIARLRAAHPDVMVHAPATTEESAAIAAGVDAALFGTTLPDEFLRPAVRLKWVQSVFTGVDGIVRNPLLRTDVVLTNVRGINGPSVAEAALTMMLALTRDVPRVVRNQDRRNWDAFTVALLDGKTVGIVGTGSIGGHVARRCKAFGMTTVGVSVTPRAEPHYDRMVARADFARAVADFDFVVLTAPLTPETTHIVDAAMLAAMKPSARLVNVARGGLIDDDALVKALKAGRIAGAALDPFVTEPLPADHAYWSLPNMIVFPHNAGWRENYERDAFAVFEINLRHFLTGDMDKLVNVVPR